MREQENHSKEIITEAIESCMNKQAENLVNSLDVISGRLSQLELYCYKLERSIGELRSDVMDYHSEANLNFRSLDKNVKEVCPVLHPDTGTPFFELWMPNYIMLLVSCSKCISKQ